MSPAPAPRGRLTVLLTGATSGVGREAARRLAAAGHRVLGVGRDPDRAAALTAELRATATRSELLAADLSARAGWDAVAAWAAERTDRLDALVHNAGVMTRTRQETPDGNELNLAVHHLAPFALTGRLWPLLGKGAVPDGPPAAPGGPARALPRVVCVNSEGHRSSMGGHTGIRVDFDDLQSRRGFDPFLTYSRTKLANLYFAYELARRHGDEAAVAALHPGVVRTDLGRQFPKVQVMAVQLMAISPRRSATSVTALAVEPLDRNGGYYDRDRPARSSGPSYDEAAARRMWAATEELCGPFGG
ncbi:SDR family NAD(P)-dependent oxidoreductase [Allonocardiopsis opalescens]|uniref:Short-subunit dehydrogenase n=1 Tax=Allonocardiopsis opalescens TaxID=1144618 RepID=A0A2T0QCA6_9ACTN|nr:SDR family NAD(P)-dependent oxidoreductase [Allonocardiopsis opalescens]PRY01549.1 short-subunit dehydrogenase [Allonocardiopsis opalescens]